ncbi:MAG: 3-methyl-2-oxobutanoate hydroxymethyltransferase [Deltaproteobacteria bacterium]|nr:3-methyl-2-oxobutanoate hydroxymethyltransferase [Deltaproteobacteria bacterium]HCH66208.1 3-methyl-2-oxobutanoate hydroxymethyltransferase [Deltaproteobacteria bacterium]
MSNKTVLDLQKMKAGNQRIAMVTAYDATMARLVDQGGADMVLVGDSLGMVVQGHSDTLQVTLDHMVYHGQCVARGLEAAHLTVDLPFMSYQVSPEQALVSAGRLVQEGRAQSVKLEGGVRSAPAVRRIVEAGIPVVGHVGLTPQSVNAFGGFRVQGRGDAGAEKLLADALAIQEAGAFCIVLEMVPAELAAEVTAALDIITIGIGAGVECDGQVLVCNDLLGFDTSFKPRFVKRFAELEAPIVSAVSEYVGEVRSGTFPASEHAFHRRKGPSKVKRLYGGRSAK